jgi:hypothetical protein
MPRGPPARRPHRLSITEGNIGSSGEPEGLSSRRPAAHPKARNPLTGDAGPESEDAGIDRRHPGSPPGMAMAHRGRNRRAHRRISPDVPDSGDCPGERPASPREAWRSVVDGRFASRPYRPPRRSTTRSRSRFSAPALFLVGGAGLGARARCGPASLSRFPKLPRPRWPRQRGRAARARTARTAP